MSDVVEGLRAYQQGDADGVMVLVSRQACDEGAAEIETLRAAFKDLYSANDRLLDENFALAAGQCANVTGDEGGTPQCAEIAKLRGEQAVLVRLLLEADKVLSTITIEGECQEEWDQLADLRRAIAAATIPHRPEEADLLSLRACIGA